MRPSAFDIVWHDRKIIFLISLCVVAGFLLIGGVQIYALSLNKPTPQPIVHHIAEDLNGLTLLWSRDDVYVKQLDASMGIGCFIGDLGKQLYYSQMFCFHDERGEIVWEEKSFRNEILAATPYGLFVAAQAGTFNYLAKYNIKTGALIFGKKLRLSSIPTGLVFFNDQVQLLTTKPDRLSVVDTDGNTLKVIADSDVFLTTPEVTFSRVTGITATRTDTKDVLWDYVEMGYSEGQPMVTQDKIFGRNDSHSGTAYALDRVTGKLLWQVRDILYSSNLAYSPDRQRVYALRNSGELLAVDEETGNLTIVAKFSPVPFVNNISGIRQIFQLAYDQDQHVLLVSLEDGHQIFAFREE